MNINDKLRQVMSNAEDVQDIINSIVEEQKQLEMNLHIFKTIRLAEKIENAVNKGYFNEPEVVSITLFFDDKDYVHFQVGFCLTNEYGTQYTEDDNAVYYDKPIEFFADLFNELGKFKIDFMNEDYNQKTFKLSNGIKEEIIEVFLNDELKKIYDYNKMQLELPDNNENNGKKLKM